MTRGDSNPGQDSLSQLALLLASLVAISMISDSSMRGLFVYRIIRGETFEEEKKEDEACDRLGRRTTNS